MASCRVYTGNNNGVNVRSAKAVSSSNLLGVIDNDVYVNVVRCDSTWATLIYNGTPAFLQHQYLVNPPSTNGDGLDTSRDNKAVCNASAVNIRDGADGSTTGSTLAKGANVTVYGKEYAGGYYWYRIGSNQWVRGDFLAPSTGGSSGGGNTGGGTTSHTAMVCQGDTDDAGDCCVFYDELSSVYSDVEAKGFNPSTSNATLPRATQANFKAAHNYDVLYWSSHGDPTPTLNYLENNGALSFNSYTAANASWTDQDYNLKVAIMAACYQLDTPENRSRWASIMRNSDIRVICGYHEGSPGHPYDKNLAEDFFYYVNAGSTGNSVMYSWQHANQDNGNNSTYMVLVYQNDNQCYYRLPGFSTRTYRAPNKSTDSIYAYASFMTGAVTAAANLAPNSLIPYELVVADKVTPSKELAVSRAVCCSWQKASTGETFVGYGEFPNESVDAAKAQEFNMAYAVEAFGSELLDKAEIRNVDTVMFEVFDDGVEGEHTIIGHATQFINHYNGIPLAHNCIVVTSDADGLHSISNKWRDVTPALDTAMVQMTSGFTTATTQAITSALRTNESMENIKSADYIYVEKNGRYVLHRDVELQNRRHILIDCQNNSTVK